MWYFFTLTLSWLNNKLNLKTQAMLNFFFSCQKKKKLQKADLKFILLYLVCQYQLFWSYNITLNYYNLLKYLFQFSLFVCRTLSTILVLAWKRPVQKKQENFWWRESIHKYSNQPQHHMTPFSSLKYTCMGVSLRRSYIYLSV